MESKIQELTEKIYLEGVEKGEKEAERLIEEAQIRRKTLIDDAQEEAKEIITKAQKQAIELKKNTESELKIYATQAIAALKSEVANLITDKASHAGVKTSLNQPDFMSQTILKLVSEWAKNEKLTIGTAEADELKTYFEIHAKEILDKGLTIEQVNGKKHSFIIAPVNGAYKINIGEDEFIEFFKEFLRPHLINLLF